MYENYSFIGEEELVVDNFKDALDKCQERERNVITAKYKDIQATTAGSIKIKGDEHQITQWGFEKFCGILGIPKPFARKIPQELLDENIAKLLKEKDEEDEMLLFNSKKGLVGVAKGGNDPFDNVDFLSQMSTMYSSKIDLHNVIVNDRGITVNFFSPMIPSLEPKQGDVTRVGFNTHNSDTGGCPTISHLFLYRLQCENGAIMKEVWGSAKRTYNKKITKETSLINFSKQTESISTNAVLLTDCFGKMVEWNVEDEYFKKCWNTVRRIVGSESVVDEALEVSAEGRKELFAKISKRKSVNRMKLIDNISPEEAEPMDFTYYDLYNKVTAMEKEFTLDEKINLRKAGGEILYKILKEVSMN